MSRAERALFTADKLRAIRSDFSTLSARWSNLKIGEAFSVPWQVTGSDPQGLTPPSHAAPA
jgi:hypothetical protein